MDVTAVATKPHAVCIPLPAQSHIKAMLKFAKLLHHRGFHITFVNSKYNHRRFLKSWGPNSLDGLPDFQFKAIPDGLPDSDADTTQDVPLLCDSVRKQNFLRDEVEKLVKELIEGEKGEKMKNKVMMWKKLTEEATEPHGSSSKNLNMLVNQVLLRKI
ncbi:UDP-glycosyltransferase 85A5-like [Pyrus ussuriensis x Pyrus communis]|uniref:UDP-glycosyltransferase 85A5-like n=1 Tax=Pyrus ussuriensis x Pyrus communis TaxID=2448454 RepID=A0A5N5GRH9_9ROSA|nr:UDP-glycosyltransferase 85A5-like [Pyrus ussuriensis x Pyrus communis]